MAAFIEWRRGGNKLSLNLAKTHSMLISTKQKGNSLRSRNGALELKIRDNELEVVQKTQYLGVQIDCHLDCKEQIKAFFTKVSRAIGLLRHAESFLSKTLGNFCPKCVLLSKCRFTSSYGHSQVPPP